MLRTKTPDLGLQILVTILRSCDSWVLKHGLG